MPYIIKNISSNVVAIPLEGILSISLLPGKRADLTQWCTNEWILRNETLSGLVTKRYLAVVHDTISGTSPYYDSITEDSNKDVHIAKDAQIVLDGRVGGDLTVDGDLIVDGDIIDEDHGVLGKAVKQTTEDFTLYVRTTGNDTNEGLTVGTALATIQEAINRIPKFIEHLVTIDIGEGSFAGFKIEQFHIKAYGDFNLTGKLGQPTLTTGTPTGTATGGNQRQCIDTGQNWTTDELIGMLLKVGSEYRIIRNNTSDTINLAGAFSVSCSGQAYEILEQKTIINTDPDGDSLVGYFNGIISASTTPMYISDIKFDSTGIAVGVAVQYCLNGPVFERITFANGTYPFWSLDNAGYAFQMLHCCAMNGSNRGFYILRNNRIRDFTGTLAYNNGSHGIDITNVGEYGNMGEIYADSNGGAGLYVANAQFIDVDYGGMDGNTTYGVHVDENAGGGQGDNRRCFSFANMVGTFNISNNTSGGIKVHNHSILGLTTCTGTGNGGFGLELQTGSYATITSATTITGSSGDATIDDGITPLVWVTDFANDGDTVSNDNNYCTIERKD